MLPPSEGLVSGNIYQTSQTHLESELKPDERLFPNLGNLETKVVVLAAGSKIKYFSSVTVCGKICKITYVKG